MEQAWKIEAADLQKDHLRGFAVKAKLRAGSVLYTPGLWMLFEIAGKPTVLVRQGCLSLASKETDAALLNLLCEMDYSDGHQKMQANLKAWKALLLSEA